MTILTLKFGIKMHNAKALLLMLFEIIANLPHANSKDNILLFTFY